MPIRDLFSLVGIFKRISCSSGPVSTTEPSLQSCRIIGLIINFTAIILSATGILVPTTAAMVHNCGSASVVVNAAMILREKDRSSHF